MMVKADADVFQQKDNSLVKDSWKPFITPSITLLYAYYCIFKTRSGVQSCELQAWKAYLAIILQFTRYLMIATYSILDELKSFAFPLSSVPQVFLGVIDSLLSKFFLLTSFI